MRQKITYQTTIWEPYHDHPFTQRLKTISFWLDQHPRIRENVTRDLQGDQTKDTDGYVDYSHLVKLLGVINAGDMDQVRRKFADVCKAAGKNRKKKGYADQALERIYKLYAIERRLKCDKADVQEVVTTRRDEARLILDQLKPWLEELAAKVPPSGLLGRAINYTLKQWPKLLVYLDHGHVP